MYLQTDQACPERIHGRAVYPAVSDACALFRKRDRISGTVGELAHDDHNQVD